MLIIRAYRKDIKVTVFIFIGNCIVTPYMGPSGDVPDSTNCLFDVIVIIILKSDTAARL